MSANHKYIQNLLNNYLPNGKATIVDYGCGNGDLLNYLDTQNIVKYTGYDVSKDCLHIAKNNHFGNKYKFKRIDLQKLPNLGTNNSVDLIILVGVVQYMSNQEINHLLKEAKKVLKNDGILVVSCAVDHDIYKFFNIYRIFLPNNYINRKQLINKANKNNLISVFNKEKGLVIAPLFSNIFSLFFDSIDRFILGNRGKIGIVGSTARKLIQPLIELEYLIPVDFGYTLYCVFRKK